MTTRDVTKLLKAELHPLLREWGFAGFTGRKATKIDGPITVAIQLKSVTKRFSEVTGAPLGSFGAAIGIDYGTATGAGYLRPEILVHDQMGLRALLSRTEDRPKGARADLWFPPIVGVVEAVADVVRAFETQGRAFLDDWTDLDRAYENLLELDWQVDGAIGSAALMLPGTKGSRSRLGALAVVAALRGDVTAERTHLIDCLDISHHAWMVERLAELEGT